MRRVFVMTTGTATLGLGCWLLVSAGSGTADDPAGKPVLPEPDFMKLATHDIKVIQDALGKGTLDKKTGRKVKAAAFMVAAYAQNQMQAAGKAESMAGLRDNALKVLKAV